MQVLPKKVPCPLESFSWEDMQQVEWQPAQVSQPHALACVDKCEMGPAYAST